jgi:hypothetical protein
MGPHLNLIDIGRNCLLGNRKKIAKFLMRTFTCRSTFLYESSIEVFLHVTLESACTECMPNVSDKYKSLSLYLISPRHEMDCYERYHNICRGGGEGCEI